VVSLYARRTEEGYEYRLVDEYQGEFLEGETQVRRPEQLTQAEVVEFFLSAYPLAGFCEGNELTGQAAQEFTIPYSAYYPDFEARVRAYLWEMCPIPDADEDDESEDEED
jgi:hypothetical protein